jgi:hypothetical protein
MAIFHVIEFWIENRLMLEIVPRSLVGADESMLQFEPLDRYFAAPLTARVSRDGRGC